MYVCTLEAMLNCSLRRGCRVCIWIGPLLSDHSEKFNRGSTVRQNSFISYLPVNFMSSPLSEDTMWIANLKLEETIGITDFDLIK